MNINETLTSLIGPSWRTSIYGFLSKISMGFILASVLQPDLIYNMFGNTPFTKTFISIGLFLWFAFGFAKDLNTKDKQVTGNSEDKVSEGIVQTKTAP